MTGTIEETQTPVLWRCIDCGREFVDEESLRIHSELHEAGEPHLSEKELLLRRELLYKAVREQEDEESERQILPQPQPRLKPRRIYRPPSKRVGLTKVRLEDCLRCDACSCIYIDEQDYYKHMRNFHQKYNTLIPRSRKRSQYGYGCGGMSWRGEVGGPEQALPSFQATPALPATPAQPTAPAQLTTPALLANPALPTAPAQPAAPTLPAAPAHQQPPVSPSTPSPLRLSGTFFKETIKSRWSKVSKQLTAVKSPPKVAVKSEPLDNDDLIEQHQHHQETSGLMTSSSSSEVKVKEEADDMDFFLSQVEVKIKTEPPDY